MLIISRVKDGHLNYGLDNKTSLGMKLLFKLLNEILKSLKHESNQCHDAGGSELRTKVDRWSNDKKHRDDHYLTHLCSKLEFISLLHIKRILAN